MKKIEGSEGITSRCTTNTPKRSQAATVHQAAAKQMSVNATVAVFHQKYMAFWHGKIIK